MSGRRSSAAPADPEAPAESSRRAKRRREIVAAAAAIVAERGLDALTFRELEAQLGYSRGVITYHFASKDEIVLATFAAAVEANDREVRGAIEAGVTLEAQVEHTIRGMVLGFVKHRELGHVLLSFWGRIGADRSIVRQNAELYAGYRRYTRRMLERWLGARSGRLDLDATAAALVGVVIGVVAQAYFEPGAIDPERASAEAARAFVARLRGDPSLELST